VRQNKLRLPATCPELRRKVSEPQTASCANVTVAYHHNYLIRLIHCSSFIWYETLDGSVVFSLSVGSSFTIFSFVIVAATVIIDIIIVVLLPQIFFFLVLFPLSQRRTPPPRLQASDCSTSCMMCDVPSMAVLELFPDSFVNFHLQFPWPQWLSVWQKLSCSAYAKFLCRIKLSLQPCCFSPFLQVLGCCAFYLFCVTLKRFLEVWGRLMRAEFECVLTICVTGSPLCSTYSTKLIISAN
jgi:hypothetical protein